MPFYQTRRVVRDCEQWTGENAEFLSAKFGLDVLFVWDGDRPEPTLVCSIYVNANDAWLVLQVGEWIIRDSHGIYPCKDDVFHEKYEELK